jgi:hypothetical protein
MMDLDEILDDAEAAPKSTRLVRVCVKPAVAVQRARLLDALERAKREDSREESSDTRLGAEPERVDHRTRAALVDLEAFDEEARKALIEIRFTRLEGNAWALLTSANPMRVDVAIDRHYGYDYDAVSELAARANGVRVDDDGEHEITADQWDRLLKILSGHDVEAIRDAIWTLNEYEPEQHVEALVKGFGAA